MESHVIKLAETRVDHEGVRKLLGELGGNALNWLSERNKTWPSESEMLIEVAGRTCYESFGTGINPNITKVRNEPGEYFRNILSKGDGSILEHASVTFALVWVSRVLTHELVRHRVGTAYSQESLRYVRIQEIRMPEWRASVDPKKLSIEIEQKMTSALKELESQYREIVDNISWDTLSFDEKKGLTSAIRRVLPQGLATVIVFTANHRTLRWLIEMRTTPGAEYEIRMIFGKIAEIILRDYPLVYSDFEKIDLHDGTFQYVPTIRSKV